MPAMPAFVKCNAALFTRFQRTDAETYLYTSSVMNVVLNEAKKTTDYIIKIRLDNKFNIISPPVPQRSLICAHFDAYYL
jgi:hypothetical protein